jgi:hypothetical protein
VRGWRRWRLVARSLHRRCTDHEEGRCVCREHVVDAWLAGLRSASIETNPVSSHEVSLHLGMPRGRFTVNAQATMKAAEAEVVELAIPKTRNA